MLPNFASSGDTPHGHISDPTCPETWVELQDGQGCQPGRGWLRGSPGELVSEARGSHRLGLSCRWYRSLAGGRIQVKQVTLLSLGTLICLTWGLVMAP